MVLGIIFLFLIDVFPFSHGGDVIARLSLTHVVFGLQMNFHIPPIVSFIHAIFATKLFLLPFHLMRVAHCGLNLYEMKRDERK